MSRQSRGLNNYELVMCALVLAAAVFAGTAALARSILDDVGGSHFGPGTAAHTRAPAHPHSPHRAPRSVPQQVAPAPAGGPGAPPVEVPAPAVVDRQRTGWAAHPTPAGSGPARPPTPTTPAAQTSPSTLPPPTPTPDPPATPTPSPGSPTPSPGSPPPSTASPAQSSPAGTLAP